MLNISQYEKEPPKKQGLTEHKHHFLSCSSCGKQLVDVMVIKPNPELTWEMIANCCYCGDKSMPVKVVGRYAVSGVGTINPEDPENDFRYATKVTKVYDENNITFFNTVKVN